MIDTGYNCIGIKWYVHKGACDKVNVGFNYRGIKRDVHKDMMVIFEFESHLNI